MKQPLIMIGMHRSGTTLISQILEKCGLFIGKRKQSNCEAIFFLQLNSWMFREANASWDNPTPFGFINTFFVDQAQRVIETHLSRFPMRRRFLGNRLALKYESIAELDMAWGWKDPRNTFTIDVWKEIFPNAKLLHIYRNPIDVARSLMVREKRRRDAWLQKSKNSWVDTLKEFTTRGTVAYQTSYRVENVHEGISLWEAYVTKAISLNEEFHDRILHVKFEDFVMSPHDHLRQIIRFAGLKDVEEEGLSALNFIDTSRKYAFAEDEKLVQIYRDLVDSNDASLVCGLGYDNIL